MSASMSRTAAIVLAIVLLVVGIAAGYGIGYATLKPVTKTVTVTSPTTVTVTVPSTSAAPAAATPAVTVTKTVTVTVTPKPPAKKWTVYFIPHAGPADPFWACQMRAAQAAAALLPEIDLKFVAPERYGIKEQIELIEAAIAKKPDFLIVTISNAEAMDPVLRKAIKAGIPVLAVNIEDYRPEEKRIPYLGYVGMDERISGEILAKAAFKRFKAITGRLPKRVVVGIHQPGLICLEMRTDGIMKVAKELGVPCDRLDITMDPTKAMEILRSYLKKHPDTEMIFTLGPCGSHPAIKLIKELGLKGKVYHACIDLSPKILDAIEEGVTLCAVSQQPAAQAFYAVFTAYLYLKYGILPPMKIPTGPTVVDKENLAIIRKQVKTTGGA